MRREIIETPNPTNNGDPEKIFHSGPTKEEGKELAYTNEFADFVKAHPDFLIKTKKAVDALFSLPSNEPVPAQEIDGVKIEYLGCHGRDERKYYKVTVDGRVFFLKVNSLSNSSRLFSGAEGAEGLLAMRKIKEALQGFGDFKVSAINYQIGYKDGNRSYFLAAFDERMRATVDDKLNDLWEKINKIRKNSKDQNVQKLFNLTQTRDYLRQIYFANIYGSKSFNQKRAALVKRRLDNLDITINQECQGNLDAETSEFVKLVQTKDELMLKYYQIRSYLDSKGLASDFHQRNISFDRSKNEALVFDIKEGHYHDIDDMFPDDEISEIIRSLGDDVMITYPKKSQLWPFGQKSPEKELNLMRRVYGELESSGVILRYQTAIGQPEANPAKVKENIIQNIVSQIKRQYNMELSEQQKRQFLEWLENQATQA